MTIAARLQQIKANIANICNESGRDPAAVHIIGVTKYANLETTKAALDAGITHIGENRVESAMVKWDQLNDRGTWHFIGSLQSKKSKKDDWEI